MDFMRKLVRGNTINPSQGAQSTSDNTYDLLTLRRKYLEISHSQRPTTTKETEDKLYSMLTIFHKVFANAPPQSMREKFGDVLQFATHVSKLMVTEIRRRASDKSTEVASLAIIDFLLVQDKEESSKGWILLNTLCLLSTGGQNIVDGMTSVHLPSTLVRCLYLFFDLPTVLDSAPPAADVHKHPSSDEEQVHPRSQTSTDPESVAVSPSRYSLFQGSKARATTERPSRAEKKSGSDYLMDFANSSVADKRSQLQKVFVRTLVRLCKHISPSEELSQRDDLNLLFSAITSFCPPHNVSWRLAAAEVLGVISRHGLSHNVVQYIRNEKCIANCVDNLRRSMLSSMNSIIGEHQAKGSYSDGEMSELELVQALVCIMRFVRDTTEVTQTILDDFKRCNGYGFLIEFLLRLELLAEGSDIHHEATRSIVSNLEILTTSGFLELPSPPAVQTSPFQASFSVPKPRGKGASVRNVQAFQVLEQVFIRGRTVILCDGALEGILNIYRRDPANYFILASQQTISTFTEPLLEKRSQIFPKFFALLEYVALELSYVPTKELVSLSLILKDDRSAWCSVACVESLRKILSSNPELYKDVYREVGVLEVLVTCLHKYAAILKSSDELEESRSKLGPLCMDVLADLLKDCPANATVFRETGGARCAHNLVPCIVSRSKALNIVEALILKPHGSSADDDDMGTLLGLLSTVHPKNLSLKTDILKSLLKVITESKDARTMFRKVGGFINVISALVSVEGCLEYPSVGLWAALELEDILQLLEVIIHTLCVALRLPSNKRFFHSEVRFESLRRAVRYLGCFTDDNHMDKTLIKDDSETFDSSDEVTVTEPPLLNTALGSINLLVLLKSGDKWDTNSVSILAVFRFLYMLATDTFKNESDNHAETQTHLIKPIIHSPSHRNVPRCNHSLVVNIMLQLIPLIPAPTRQMQIDLQYYILEQINSLLESERNQQILCKSGLLSSLLGIYSDVLCDDSHPLNSSVQRIMERLATQTITPRELRELLRNGNPLHCRDAFISAGSVSLSRVKNLVSMATPRNMSFQDDGMTNFLKMPDFLEFDMSRQGCSYLFIPSLFPQVVSTVASAAQSEEAIVSGVGTGGERTFPPPAGLTVSTWVYVDKFCSQQIHPIRILTVTREVMFPDDPVQYSCLSIHISAKSRSIVISTHENNFNHMGPGDLEAGTELISAMATFPTVNLIYEARWHHLVVVMTKATVLKHSTAVVYLNGRQLGTAKLRYIHNSPGGHSSVANATIQVRGYIGTPPCLRSESTLLWRLASINVADDASFASLANVIAQYQLGPSYVGNFQSVKMLDGNYTSLLSEEHLCFSLHPHACETASCLRIRRQCHKVDCKAIANELQLSVNDGLTPVLLVKNSCTHMPGAARSLGGVTVYDQASAAVRNFIPGPISRVLQNVGGTAIILNLVSMATDVESLYAAVKSLVCVVKNNKAAADEMDKKRGYQALAMHLRRKKHLLNSHVLHLAYSLAGTVDVGRECAFIPNVMAFEDLLCDLEVWHNAPDELHKSLLEHIYDLLTESSDVGENSLIINERDMVKRCLHFILGDAGLSYGTIKVVFRILGVLLKCPGNHANLLRYGQFLSALLPPIHGSEKDVALKEPSVDLLKDETISTEEFVRISVRTVCARNIHLRNMGLKLLRRSLYDENTGKPDVSFCDDIQHKLGWDWMLLFLGQNVHDSTVVEATLLLLEALRCGSSTTKGSYTSSVSTGALSTAALSSTASIVGAGVSGSGNTNTTHSSAYERFKHGELFGGWLNGTEAILENREDSLLGFNVGSGEDTHYQHQVCREACSAPGFQCLTYYLMRHMDSPRLYIALLQFAVSDKMSDPPFTNTIDLDIMYELIFGINRGNMGPASPRKKLKSSASFSGTAISPQNNSAMCLEVFQVILSMVRSMVNQDWAKESSNHWTQTYPIVMLQTLIFIYQFNYNSLASAFVTSDFITYLCSTVFPRQEDDEFYLPLVEDTSTVPPKSPTSSSKAKLLSTHPCKKFIFSLFQNIVFDSLSLPPSSSSAGKNGQVIDLILEFSPQRSSASQLKEFQTDIINHLFSNLIDAEPFMGEGGVLLTHGSHAHVTGKKGQSSSAAYDNLQQNVAYFTSRVVDRIWQGMYNQDVRTVFDYIKKLLFQAKHKGVRCSQPVLDSMFRSLYRVALYQLSRQHQSISEQMTVLDALHSLTTNRELIFENRRNDQLFLSGLCHCLFMLSGDSAGVGFGVEDEPRQTTWHIVSHGLEESSAKHDGHESENTPGQPTSPKEKGKLLLSKAAARVWTELMTSKKQTIEDIYKVQFLDLGPSQASLDAARMKVKDVAAKMWSGYLGMEKKGQAGTKETVNISKLAKKVTTLALIGGSRKTKKDFTSKSHRYHFTLQDNSVWALNHLTVVQDLVNFQHNCYRQDQDHLIRYADEEWSEIQKELVRERGIWGPERPTPLHKWMLDSTEGPCRMRKKLTRNDNFYEHYPHRTKEEVVNMKLKHRKPISRDSLKYYNRINGLPEEYDECENSVNDSSDSPRFNLKNVKQDSQDLPSENGEESRSEIPINTNEDKTDEPKTKHLNVNVTTDSQHDDGSVEIDSNVIKAGTIDPSKDENENATVDSESDKTKETDSTQSEKAESESSDDKKLSEDSGKDLTNSEAQGNMGEQENKPDNQTVLRLLEEGEKIRHMFRCARVQGLDTYEGLLLFGKDNFYIIDGFTMLKSKEIREIDSISPAYHEPIFPQTSRPGHNPYDPVPSSVPSHHCSRFSYSHVREVHKRRYLLQDIALEVFSRDGRNYLIVFPQGIRNKVYQKLVSFATTLADNSKDLVIGQKITVNIEQQGPALLTNIMGEKTVTQRWERGEISNFQYLMYINTLAGRSYNDLMQYPVFPWVLADYTSEVLDLTNPKTFRDLSKAMGAQTPDRLEQFKKRYREWEDLGGETPPYHYGTHYSSAMIVASYLVRMEPFTQHFLRLQGGHFDLADRMFHSIKDAWHSASEKNMADVKELIPEFFYLPEFLVNSNNFDLGQKQNGIRLDDIILPTWAKGSPREFIRMHREALECDYVSAHLHEWIDLVFGCKQNGDAAYQAHNVFHHLFYEGEVDIYSIEDPLKRSATIGFINNFGQIPKQLFKKPHAQKRISLKPQTHEQEIGAALSLAPSAFGAGPPADKVFYRHLDNLKSSLTPVKDLREAVGEIVVTDRGAFATEQFKTLIPPQYSRFLSWGNRDLSIRIGYYESERAMQVFENLDCGEIKCVTMPTETTLITGGTSTVVEVWDIPAPRDRNKTMQLTQSLYGHTDTVSCLASCPAYGVLVSGSYDCTCIVWNLNQLCFVRQLRSHKSAVLHTCINELTGDIVTSDSTHVHLWSINGVHIAAVNTTLMNARRQRITAITVTKLNEWDPDSVIITGHSDGYVRFWRLEYVQVPENCKDLDQYDDGDQHSLKSLGNMTGPVHKRHQQLMHDMKSLDSISITSGLAPSDFAINDKVQTTGGSNQNQSKTVNLSPPDAAPDAVSILSVGEISDIPWSDIPALELAQDKAQSTMQSPLTSTTNEPNTTADVSMDNDETPSSVPIVTSYSRVELSGEDNSKLNVKDSQAQPTVSTPSTEEEYVVVDQTQLEAQLAKEARLLQPGFVWQEQLIFKGKFQVDQAKDSAGRPSVPDVTAIAMSKDHHKLYIGDRLGRIYYWISAD